MGFLNKYRGLLRTVGGALGGVGSLLIATGEPSALALGAILVKAGGIIGGLGVARAGLRYVAS
jgi:hypothetical protein